MMRSAAMKKSEKWAELIRKCYPTGTRVECDGMDDIRAVAPGTRGTITYVDDAGQIHVAWETGSSLVLVPGIDHFHCVGGNVK